MAFLKSGHKVVPLLGEEGQRQIEEFEASKYGTLRLEPGNWFFAASFLRHADKYYDFQFRPSDVLINTYAKCGTTWTQEIIWTLIHNPDLNHPRANVSVNVRSPNLEADMYGSNTTKTLLDPGQELHDNFVREYPNRDPKNGIFPQLAELAEDPRIIKTHLPLSLLSPKTLDTCKVIYLTRQPKDVALSYYDYSRKFRVVGFVSSLDSFIDHFTGTTMQTGPFWPHVKESWDKREHPNMLFCYFEDLKTKHREMVVKFAEFLGLDRTPQQIDNVVNWTSFAEMKKRDNLVEGVRSELFMKTDIVNKEGGFFNKGQTGSWKAKLSPEQVAKLDAWTKENVKDFDGDFKYKHLV